MKQILRTRLFAYNVWFHYNLKI